MVGVILCGEVEVGGLCGFDNGGLEFALEILTKMFLWARGTVRLHLGNSRRVKPQLG